MKDILCYVKWSWIIVNAILACVAPQAVLKVLARLKYSVPLYKAESGFSILTEECLTFRTISPTEIYGMSGSISLTRHLLLSGGAVRRNSLRCAPFGPPTVSCVLAPARTCLRQAPPTSRGRGLATSAVLHHLSDDMSIKAFNLGKRCKKTPLFTPFQKK